MGNDQTRPVATAATAGPESHHRPHFSSLLDVKKQRPFVSESGRSLYAVTMSTLDSKPVLFPSNKNRNEINEDDSDTSGSSHPSAPLRHDDDDDDDDEEEYNEDVELDVEVVEPEGTNVPRGKKGKSRGNWTMEQDEALRSAVERHEGKNWRAIAAEVPGGRNHTQCLQRWAKVLKPGLVKGPWTVAEDDLLRNWVFVEPKGNWVAVAKHIPGRTAKQCRERWCLCLDPTIDHSPWSIEEDRLLVELHNQYGNKWAAIAQAMSGRTENAVKSRFKSMERRREKSWTQQEDELVRNGPGDALHISYVHDRLPNRTKWAIKRRFKELVGPVPPPIKTTTTNKPMSRKANYHRRARSRSDSDSYDEEESWNDSEEENVVLDEDVDEYARLPLPVLDPLHVFGGSVATTAYVPSSSHYDQQHQHVITANNRGANAGGWSSLQQQQQQHHHHQSSQQPIQQHRLAPSRLSSEIMRQNLEVIHTDSLDRFFKSGAANAVISQYEVLDNLPRQFSSFGLATNTTTAAAPSLRAGTLRMTGSSNSNGSSFGLLDTPRNLSPPAFSQRHQSSDHGLGGLSGIGSSNGSGMLFFEEDMDVV